ncbi:hypothetical protein [Sneathiella sp.]|uniref:hypothetical protein n=1 Tax=Sneathiella sp. TaxID=1964365 RepID=UPI002FDF7551
MTMRGMIRLGLWFGSILLLLPAITASGFAADRFVDPAAAPGGEGSHEAPWRDIQHVLDQKLIAPGDRLLLKGGNYGRVRINDLAPPERVVIEAAGETPAVFEMIEIMRSRNVTLKGLTVTTGGNRQPGDRAHVRIDKQSRDITVEGLEIYTISDSSDWSAGEWDEKSLDGIFSEAENAEIRGNRLRNIRFGISTLGRRSVVAGNEVVNFAGDGLRGLGDDSLFEGNIVKNCYQVNDNHADGFQSWSTGADGRPGTGTIRNVTLRGNLFLNYEDFHQRYPCKMEGIGLFNGVYEGWTIENNIVIVNNWHGISAFGMRASRIAHNTVMDIDYFPPGPAAITIISLAGEAPAGRNLLINNVANEINIEGDGVDAAGNIELDDLDDVFEDVDAGDYRLPKGSDVISAGVPFSKVTTDFFGRPRAAGSGADAGAVARAN